MASFQAIAGSKELFNPNFHLEPPSTELFEEKLQKTHQETKSLFERLAAMRLRIEGHVPVSKLEEWKQELVGTSRDPGLSSRVTINHSKLEYLQFVAGKLNNAELMANSFEDLQSLEIMDRFVLKTHKYLNLVLKSPDYKGTAENVLKWVHQGASQLTLEGDASSKLDGLIPIIREAHLYLTNNHARNIKLSRKLQEGIKTLSLNLVTFYKIALKQLGEELNLPEKEDNRIRALQDLLNEIQNLSVPPSKNPGKQEDDEVLAVAVKRLRIDDQARGSASKYKEDFKEESLDDDFSFHHLHHVSRMPLASCKITGEVINDLRQQVAKGLKFLRREVDRKIMSYCQGKSNPPSGWNVQQEAHLYRLLVDDLEISSDRLTKRLDDLKVTAETFATLCYASELKYVIGEIRAKLQLFSMILQATEKKMAPLLVKLLQFLRAIKVGRVAAASSSMYLFYNLTEGFRRTAKIMMPASYVDRYAIKMEVMIRSAIEKMGPRALILTEDEKTVFDKLARDVREAKIYVKAGNELHVVVQSYLLKRAMRALAHTGQCDAEFDLSLYSLQVNYPDAFKQSLRLNVELEKILKSLLLHKPDKLDRDKEDLLVAHFDDYFGEDKALLREYLAIFSLLGKLQKNSDCKSETTKELLHIAWSSELNVHMAIVRGQTSDRLKALQVRAQEKIRSINPPPRVPPYCDQHEITPPDLTQRPTEEDVTPWLYLLLNKCMWTEDDTAVQQLEPILAHCGNGKEFEPADKYVRMLLRQYAMRQKLQGGHLSETVQYNLYLLMIDYVLKHDISLALESLYDRLDIEKVLYKLESSSQEAKPQIVVNGHQSPHDLLQAALLQKRSSFIPSWRELMKCYIDFAEKITLVRRFRENPTGFEDPSPETKVACDVIIKTVTALKNVAFKNPDFKPIYLRCAEQMTEDMESTFPVS